MKFSDYIQAPVPSAGEQMQTGNADAVRSQLRDALYEEVSSEKIAQLLASGRERARVELTAAIEQILKARDFPRLAPDDMDAIVVETLDMVLGFGPLERLRLQIDALGLFSCAAGQARRKQHGYNWPSFHGPRSPLFCTSTEKRPH